MLRLLATPHITLFRILIFVRCGGGGSGGGRGGTRSRCLFLAAAFSTGKTGRYSLSICRFARTFGAVRGYI